ncbi:unnamed protein product, partial [Linum tenue]
GEGDSQFQRRGIPPKLAEFKIPTILSCQPAPRKSKSTPISCKRKLVSELAFIDMVNRVEVESSSDTVCCWPSGSGAPVSSLVIC